jgi:translation initiation factor IF-3
MGFRRQDPRRMQRAVQQRINNRIRVPEIRVINSAGEMLGIMTTQDALRLAREEGLDLVEINPKAVPPVCKILDFGKFKYEEKKRATETKRKQTAVEVKEVKLRPKTDEHDLDFKVRAARRFLEDGNKVKFTVRFRGREIAHPQKAQEQLRWIISQIDDISHVEFDATMEGRAMTMMVSPRPAVLQQLAASRAAVEKDRKEALDARLAAKARGSDPGEEEPPVEEDDFDAEAAAASGDDDDDDDDDEGDEASTEAKPETAEAKPEAADKAT